MQSDPTDSSISDDFTTSEIELAAWLRARGHRLVTARLVGRLAEFTFDHEAKEDVASYFGGALVSGRELFGAHRQIRALITQLRSCSDPDKELSGRMAVERRPQ